MATLRVIYLTVIFDFGDHTEEHFISHEKEGTVMTKNHNMGRKSHHAQDAQYNQTMAGLSAEIGPQPTRPTVGRQQSTKSSKELPKDTK
jgi:hypothetical protein